MGTRPSPPAWGRLRRPYSGRLRAAGRLPVALRVPGLAALRLLPGRAGRSDPALPPCLPPSLWRSGARRAAGLQAPRPRGEQWAPAGEALRPRRSGNRSGAQSARPARVPGVRPAGGLAVRLSRPGLCGWPPATSSRLLWPGPSGPSRGSRRSQAEPSDPPGLHQRPPPPERPPAALGLPRPGIFMKPPQLAGCHRSGSSSRACLPGLLKGAAAHGPGAGRGRGAGLARGRG